MKTYRPIKRFSISLFFAVLVTPLLVSDSIINLLIGYGFITLFVFIFLFGMTRYITFKGNEFKTNFKMKSIIKSKNHDKKTHFTQNEIYNIKFEEIGVSMRKLKVLTIILKNKDKYIINLSSFTDKEYIKIQEHFNKSIT